MLPDEVAVLLLLSLAFEPAHAQQAYRATLAGTLVDYDSGEPVEGATIQVFKWDEVVGQAVSDPTGAFSLITVPGDVSIHVIHPDYELIEVDEFLEANDTTRVRLRMRTPAGAAITVTGKAMTEEVTRTVVTIEELKSVPGTFGDPVRALQTLPGVARPNIAEGSIVVRGAEGINTGYYVDGMPVPYMFHTLVGRSVVVPGFIDDVEFFPGGMPSRYGEVTQAAVNVRTDTQPVGATHGTITLDFLDGSAALETRLAPNLTLRAAGRYSWMHVFAYGGSVVAMKRAGGEAYEAAYFSPKYYDFFADMRWQATPTDQVSVMVMGSRDKLVFTEGRFDEDGDGEPDPYSWEGQDLPYHPPDWVDNYFVKARVRWRHDDPIHSHSTWLAVGPEVQQNLLGAWWLSRSGPYRGRVTGFSTIARRDDRWAIPALGEQSALVHGFQVTLKPVKAEDFQDVNDDPTAKVPTTTDDQFTVSAWVEAQLKNENWYVAPGIRGAFYAFNGRTSVQPEPRLTVRRAVSEDWYVKGAIGRYSQMPPIERYGQGIGNPDLPVMTSWQGSVGAEGQLRNGIQIDGSFYGGLMNDLVVRDLVVDVYNDGEQAYSELSPEFLPVRGVAYGVEALVRVQPSSTPWWGWVSMTIGRAWRIDEQGRRFPGDYDQPFSITAVAAYDLPHGFEISGRVQATSGQPFTPIYGVYVPQDQYFSELRGEINSARYPAYFRLDVRAQKVWQTQRADYKLYLDIYNTTWRRNPVLAVYNYDYSGLITLAHLPILPTLGVEASF